MYKLILVDDEEEVREGMLRKIKWADYGFEVIGQAENGKEALDIIEKTMPDVVLTDIRMPFMDGIQLSTVIRDKYPVIKIIFLTGYDDFKYAQKAIKLNVMEYILKPVLSADLVEILQKVKIKLDEEIAHKEDMMLLREHYFKSYPVMVDKFLTSLVTTKQRKNDILNRASLYNIKLEGKLYASSVISIDKNSLEEKEYTEEDTELIKFSVSNIAEEIVAKHSSGLVFTHNDYIVVIFVFNENNVISCSDPKENFISKASRVLEEIRQNIEKYMKFTVTIGIGSIIAEIENILYSYKSAVSALDYRLVVGNNRLIYIEDLEPKFTEELIFDENKEHLLSVSIKVGSPEDLSETFDILFKDIINSKASFNHYQIYLLEILATILKVSGSLDIDRVEVFGQNYNLFAEMYRFDSIDEVKDWLKKICIKLINYISGKRQDTSKLLVEDAINYINSNYSDCDMKINKVCNKLHISPNYFSSIFKKATGETFNNYLVKIRMETAKDLLSTTNLKAFEIAEKVGYTESHYFSYCFKKYYGFSPTEYRNSLNETQ